MKNIIVSLLQDLKRKYGPDGSEANHSLQFNVESPIPVKEIPTFDRNTSRRVSPMLHARYSFGGACQFGCDTWLTPAGISTWIDHPEVQHYHLSLRTHWADSAPMLFTDDKLSLFGVTEDVPDSLVYLVWSMVEEPEVWTYLGSEQTRFANLAEYLKWCAA